MSAVFKRPGDDDGIEMPVKEVVTREVLCMMFGLDEHETVYIFNEKGQNLAVLLVLDASFTPQTAGDYFIKFEREILRENNETFKRELMNDVRDMPEGSRYSTKRREASFALLKRPNCVEGIEIKEGQHVSRQMICQMFGLNENEKFEIQTESEVTVQVFLEKNSLLHSTKVFAPQSAGVYVVLANSEVEGRGGCYVKEDEVKGTRRMKRMPSIFHTVSVPLLAKIYRKLSFRAFSRLSLTCQGMLALLELEGLNKTSPLVLNITERRDYSGAYDLTLGGNNGTATIQPYNLSDLKPFVLEGLKVKGEADSCAPLHCLLRACHDIGIYNVAFKTFYSEHNCIPIIEEMLEVLRPRRAEIYLVRFNENHKVEMNYGGELTGIGWPFKKVTEELKLVTGNFDFFGQMNIRGVFHYINRLKIFQALSVREISYPVVARLLREFQWDAKIGQMKMVQFGYPDDNGDLFDGIPRHFEEIYEIRNDERSNGCDASNRRLRAGIVSNNKTQIAIMESRKYVNFRIVTIAFTSFNGYEEELEKIYREIEDLHQSIDHTFKY